MLRPGSCARFLAHLSSGESGPLILKAVIRMAGSPEKRTFVAERLRVGHRPEPTFADQISAAVAYRFADFYKLASANVSFLCPSNESYRPVQTFHSPIADGLKGMPSKVRQIVNAFFDMIARDIRVDPGVSVGVRDSHNFWPEIPCATKRKKGPNNISPTDRGDDFDHLHNRRGDSHSRVAGSTGAQRTWVNLSFVGLMRTASIAKVVTSTSIILTKGCVHYAPLLLPEISRTGREGRCQPLLHVSLSPDACPRTGCLVSAANTSGQPGPG